MRDLSTIVEVDGLVKEFNEKRAVNGVSFTIQKGEVVAILGPNGAGKTTTLLMLLGLLRPTEGKAAIFHKDPKSKAVRERIGVMLQEVSLMDGLKAKELIKLFRGYYPTPPPMNHLIQLTGLEKGDLEKRTEKLSGGQKRRVAFALALAGNPDLLFFDEPTVGMDTSSRRIFWETVKELAREGKTIIFTTHYLQEADDYAERMILFKDGHIIADGKTAEIKKKMTKQSVSFVAGEDISKERFLKLSFVTEVTEKEGRMHIVTDDTDSVLSMIYKENLHVKDIRVEKGRLEEAFEQLTKSQGEAV
ncbi:ABC transporter ATP-binding protein [Siminovitchia sp. FSL W7-1587]|uniref:ABC transporter ATP-binding protein n=1 Tax=Siminovitchia sp. FSL W7-1587 TaxID=2954699 RepID=UPI0030D360F4